MKNYFSMLFVFLKLFVRLESGGTGRYYFEQGPEGTSCNYESLLLQQRIAFSNTSRTPFVLCPLVHFPPPNRNDQIIETNLFLLTKQNLMQSSGTFKNPFVQSLIFGNWKLEALHCYCWKETTSFVFQATFLATLYSPNHGPTHEILYMPCCGKCKACVWWNISLFPHQHQMITLDLSSVASD